MRAHALVRVKLPSKEQLEIVFKALEPETRSAPTKRSKVKIEKSDQQLILKLEAKDTTALRAALNSYLRWLGLTLTILDTLSPT